MAATSYYVLKGPDPANAGELEVIGEVEAGTGEAAIRKVAGEGGLTLDGRFVAVPVRNWTEIEFEEVERAPTVRANYISEKRTNTPRVLPGQTSIEEEIEAEDLAAAIEGEDDHFAVADADAGVMESQVKA